MKNIKNQQDLIIIGGGVMGLMTAYFASPFVKNITVLEKNTCSSENKESASFSNTRSIRVDFLEPFYANLAYESQLLWLELEKQTSEELFVKCGCLNIAKKSITPNLLETYAEKSYQNLNTLNYNPIKFTKAALNKKYPQFKADFGTLDTKGGYLFLPAINRLLLKSLKARGVTLLENISVTGITDEKNKVVVQTNKGHVAGKKLVITAAKGTNELLKLIKNNTMQFPITYSRPQRKYFYPPKELVEQFLPKNFPVIAYADIGIYGHPIYDKKKGAVKIAYFVPVGMKKDDQKIKNVDDFVKECMPMLKNVHSEEITDVDNCWYDRVDDDNFILGKLPKFENIVVGTAFRGTGYKYGPLMGKILSQLALQDDTVYAIEKFSPKRFVK